MTLGPRPGWWAGWAFSWLGCGPGAPGPGSGHCQREVRATGPLQVRCSPPWFLRGRAPPAPGPSAAVGSRMGSLLSQQELGLTHSTSIPSGCPGHQGAGVPAGSYTVIRWGGRGSLYFVYQMLEKWLPPYKLCIYSCSSERDCLAWKWMCVRVYLEDLPAEILIPLLQITKNCQVFSVQKFL